MRLHISAMALLAATLAGVGGGARAAEYDVAIVQSMTGPVGFIGVPLRDGALLKVDELNKAGYFGPGNSLKAVWADDANDRGQVVTIMERYGADPAILAVLGPLAGPVAIAGLNAANERKVAAVSTTNSLVAAGTGPYAFNLTQPARITIPYLGRYAVDVLKVKNCVSIGLHDNEAVLTTEKTFVDFTSARGVKWAAQETIKGTDSDFAAVATKVAGMSGIDCVFVSTFAPQAANLIRQLRSAGLDSSIKVMGHSSMAGPDLITQGGAAVEGVYLFGDWVPGGNSPEGRAFDAAYRARYGSAPDNWAAMGYTGMTLLANAIKQAGPNPTREAVRAALAATRDLPVIVGVGKYSFDADRIPESGVQVLVVRDGKFVVAPQ